MFISHLSQIETEAMQHVLQRLSAPYSALREDAKVSRRSDSHAKCATPTLCCTANLSWRLQALRDAYIVLPSATPVRRYRACIGTAQVRLGSRPRGRHTMRIGQWFGDCSVCLMIRHCGKGS